MEMHRNQLAAAGAILAASAAIVAPALATPARDFVRTELSTGLLEEVEVRARNSDKWEVRVRTEEDTTLGLDRLAITDDGHSGWHTHAGITMVTVIAGEVVWYDGNNPACPSKIYRVGESFVEPANSIHLVRTTGGTATFTAVQMRPAGTAGRLDADQPAGCPAFQ